MIEVRAEAAHFQPDYPLDLRAQARAKAQEAKDTSAKQLKEGLAFAQSAVGMVDDALSRLSQLPGVAAQIGPALGAVSGVKNLLGQVSQAASLAADIANSPNPLTALLNAAPGIADTFLPGALPGEVTKALTIASRLAGLSSDPSVFRALPGLDALRSSVGGSTADLLIDGTMNLMSGQPFDLNRFLPGALTAVSKDLLHRALTIEEDSP